MAGHSKWANIKHRKAAQDAKRGKIFTKLIREITVAARMGGGEPADNPRLRAAVDKALGQNMTRDTIDRAIKRGAGGDDDANMEEITYEGYGKGGVAVLVETMTDNVNRTVAEVRHAFSKFAGNLGTSGSVAFLFSKRGEIFFEPGVDEERLMEVALEAGAEDVEENDDGSFLVITTPDKQFGDVIDALREAGLEFADAEVTMHPSTEAEMDADTAETVQKMIDMLEDLDDVQNVYTNASWPAEEEQ
ncbi:MAG: YebC/PmpR family DNA-binding transcriptional regulator [Alcanivorax sp.]|jgi:YebC/PmpR family DNA-binding regulatory protein|uniref:YebC/PmpR family DNA-binding transcriptional regulator n=1 Tax=Alcanivorax sp. TaxID=1872427 RepID=UPI001992551B|nr:YebC/PmpR family DNA-binding transcriptional regulator [Alcanivorax sp.]MBD3642786.1 YebC/PmpR family DNA-binding transcriptional regulator [Alcanivorax sp.]MDF1725355.1 YebC/PmpR family DNA-binding transcriptional regulator [Alcanivorax sp.]